MVYDSDWTVSPPSLLPGPLPSPPPRHIPGCAGLSLYGGKIRCGVALQIWLGDLFMVIKGFTVVQSAELRL